MRRSVTLTIGTVVMTEEHQDWPGIGGGVGLTTIPGAPSSASVVPGMAFFPDTGPLGARCKDCQFLGYHRRRAEKWSEKLQSVIAKTYLYGGCGMFRKLTGKNGPTVSGNNKACKYYKERVHKK